MDETDEPVDLIVSGSYIQFWVQGFQFLLYRETDPLADTTS